MPDPEGRSRSGNPIGMIAGMNVLKCTDGNYTMSEGGRRTQRITTYTGIEFVIDGGAFRNFVVDEERRPLATGDVSLFDSGLDSPAEILLGKMVFDPELSGSGRTPILMCQCGDPYCGALMARIIVTDQSVSWTDWAWDHFYKPSQPASNIPDFIFDLRQYTEEVVAASERSAEERPVSVVEVRETYSFLDFVFPQREKSARLNLRKRLTELHARAVSPSLDDAEGDYVDFLADLTATQALVTCWHSKRAPRTDAQRAEIIEGLSGLLASPFVERLPDVTADAMEWFLMDLQA